MKTIKKFIVEYVVPETEKERLELERIIQEAENEKPNLEGYKLVKAKYKAEQKNDNSLPIELEYTEKEKSDGD